ncbi:WD domain-containing protein 21 [Elsinoe fawcettii]|nr:WD domain-containing protein 21 [Elsinoe fawcettii]
MTLIDGVAPEATSAYQSPTFDRDLSIDVPDPIGSATIAPSGRDIALASKHGLHIIDLDNPFSPPRHVRHESPWTPADVQWSPFASKPHWIVSTSNQRALVWNLALTTTKAPIEFVLHGHYRAITDINFSPFHPELLATCAVDGFVHTWDLRIPTRPATSFNDWFAGATQVKWNRKDSHIVASSHDRFLRIWDDRKGAIPLTSIEAHRTKIYGVDWSRFNENKVITCSLDRTIKIWDYSVSDDHPERIIRTPYPVWRARHTPFGEAILAMPQRGDNRLHLFDARPDPSAPYDDGVEPVYSFKGHDDSVKEFLWRARGTVNDHMEDHREFQLISWGNDHRLILHRMRDKPYEGVGFRKGMRLNRQLQLSRKGSQYISYHDPPARSIFGELSESATWQERQTGIPPITHNRDGGAPTGRAVMTRPANISSPAITASTTVITWMKGVKFGKGSKASRRNARRSFHALSKFSVPHHQRETLSDEIIHVSDTFKKLVFEEVDVKARRAVISLSGPWGPDDKPIFVKLEVLFPRGYPTGAPARFDLGKSSALSNERMEDLENDLERIAEAHLKQRAGCLESILYYLTGEHTLKQSMAWLNLEEDELKINDKVDSSSDEEDPLGDFATSESQVLPGESTGSGVLSGNANVPIPKACGAIWAPDGRLICFFPPKALPPSLFERIHPAQVSRSNSDVMLEGLGRLHTDAEKHKVPSHGTPEESPEESDFGDTSSSSSSSESSDEIGFPAFSTPMYRRRGWQRSSLKDKLRAGSVEGSQRTSAGPAKSLGAPKPKTIVSIQCHDEILPAKIALAEEYVIFGDSTTVCRHNSDVALRHGASHIADVWSLLSFILDKEVPLISLMFDGHGSAFVMAKRALVRIQRQDSGLDLSFDEPDAVSHPALWGQSKWGNHPFSSTWLIATIFDHFERLADVQMLAMLSCILADTPAANPLLPPSMTSIYPGHTVPYFPTEETALLTSHPRITLSSSHASSDGHGHGQYGSHPSSDGFDTSAQRTSSDLPTPLSTASTPPTLSRQPSHRASLSVSPDTKPTPISTHPSFASSMWSRPFQLSSSPPARNRHSTSGDDALASSLASSGGITWGPITVHGSNATMRRAFLRDDDSEDDSEDEAPTPEDAGVKVLLKNGMSFDEEGAGDKGLMSAEVLGHVRGWRQAYAGLLDSWGLSVEAAEVRKFLTRGVEERERVLDDGMSQITMVGELRSAKGRREESQEGLVVGRCCARCGLVVSGGKEGRCTRCDMKRRALGCGVCREPVRGLHKACFNCGHVAHMECFTELDWSRDGNDADHQGLCEVGCGCDCVAHGILQLEE